MKSKVICMTCHVNTSCLTMKLFNVSNSTITCYNFEQLSESEVPTFHTELLLQVIICFISLTSSVIMLIHFYFSGRLYALQRAMEIDKKSPEARQYLVALMDHLENVSHNTTLNELNQF